MAEGQLNEDGLHFDNKTPFILSQIPWKEPKVKKGKKPDTIEVTYDPTWSEMRMEALGGRKCFYFTVWNDTKGHEYITELFEGIRGEPCATCNCVASVCCKHIIECAKEVLVNIDPSFGENEVKSEFMTGLNQLLRE